MRKRLFSLLLLFSLIFAYLAPQTGLFALSAARADSTDFPGPAGSGSYGAKVYVLPNGNFVVTDPDYGPGTQVKIGAVYLYDGDTQAEISQMTGSTDNDRVGSGGVSVLDDGNFVVSSPRWNNGAVSMAGAATWCSGGTGCPATVTAANSLVGSHTNDYVSSAWSVNASDLNDSGSTLDLGGGAYLVRSARWDTNKGAVTYCASGSDPNCSGAVSASNSLVGATAGASLGDMIGMTVTPVPSGGYIVSSPYWQNGSNSGAGAVIPCPASGCKGVVSTTNSLYGTDYSDGVGGSITLLNNGDFVVGSMSWGGGSTQNGAVTYCASVTDTNCIGKAVTTGNSLTAVIENSIVSGSGVTTLPNGDYVVKSSSWRKDATHRTGAATYCTVTGGNSSCTGQVITSANSLTGDWNQDNVGSGIFPVSGGSFIVTSGQWHNWTGAVTYCSSGAACMGQIVSATNSLVGANSGPSWMDPTGADSVGNYGGILVLDSGEYVVMSGWWDANSATKLDNKGAATFCPAIGCTGFVDPAESLLGTQAGDKVGSGNGFKLPGGAFIINSHNWTNGSTPEAGAMTFCADTDACKNTTVQLSNSLVGDQDQTDDGGNWVYPFILSNGAYLVGSYYWINGTEDYAGALTYCPPTGCTNMTISESNSLVGSHEYDYVGSWAEDVGDGLYVTSTGGWQNDTLAGAGAVTLCSIDSGCSGPITATNSVLGGVATENYYAYHDYQYDTTHHQLVVGMPFENKVVFFTLGAATVTISGNAGIGGATLSYDDGSPQTATADGSGDYSFEVPSGWSGTVTSSKSGYTFSPDEIEYTNVIGDQTGQDYSVVTCDAIGPGTVDWSVAFAGCPPGAKYIIPAGVTVRMDSDISLDRDLEVQTGGGLDPNSKTLTLTGATAQTLTGNPLTFYRLVVNKTNKTDTVTIAGKLQVSKKLTVTKGKLVSASDYGDIEIDTDGELELTSDITVGGNFTNTGSLTPNSFMVTFDGGVEQNLVANVLTSFYDLAVSSGTTLVEIVSDDNVYIENNLLNSGTLRKTQTVTATTQYYFGLAGKRAIDGAISDMEINVTDNTDLPMIWVEQVSGDHSGRTGSAGNGVGWDHYWTILVDGGAYAADVTLPHEVSPESNAKACRYVSGTIWDCRQDAVTANSVTFEGTTEFSDWAVGDQVGPTAVELLTFSGQTKGGFNLPLGWLAVLGFVALVLWIGFSGWVLRGQKERSID